MDTLPDMYLEDRMPSSQGRRLSWRTQPTRRLTSRAAEIYLNDVIRRRRWFAVAAWSS